MTGQQDCNGSSRAVWNSRCVDCCWGRWEVAVRGSMWLPQLHCVVVHGQQLLIYSCLSCSGVLYDCVCVR